MSKEQEDYNYENIERKNEEPTKKSEHLTFFFLQIQQPYEMRGLSWLL